MLFSSHDTIAYICLKKMSLKCATVKSCALHHFHIHIPGAGGLVKKPKCLWQYRLKVGHKHLMLFTPTIDKSFNITKPMLISHPLNSCIAKHLFFGWMKSQDVDLILLLTFSCFSKKFLLLNFSIHFCSFYLYWFSNSHNRFKMATVVVSNNVIVL